MRLPLRSKFCHFSFDRFVSLLRHDVQEADNLSPLIERVIEMN